MTLGGLQGISKTISDLKRDLVAIRWMLMFLIGLLVITTIKVYSEP